MGLVAPGGSDCSQQEGKQNSLGVCSSRSRISGGIRWASQRPAGHQGTGPVCKWLAGAKRQLMNSPGKEKLSLLGVKAPKPGGRVIEGWAWDVQGLGSARVRNCISQQLRDLLDHLLGMVLHEEHQLRGDLHPEGILSLPDRNMRNLGL